MRKRHLLEIVVIVLVIFLSFSAWAIPGLINYQGILTDPDNNPLNGSYEMYFSIYTVESGGSPLWNESQTVTVIDGFYSLQLGAASPFPTGMFDNDFLYLEIKINNEILAPRQRITSTAFSIKAGDADTVDGYHASDFVGAGQTNSITGSMIEDNSVSSSDIADNAVTSVKISDGTIQQTDLSFSLPDGHSLDAADGAPVNALYVDNAGNVGIGTTGPAEGLELYNKNLAFFSSSRPENYRRLYLHRTGIGSSSFGYKFSWRNDDGSPRVNAIELDETGSVYFNGGNVGIGTNDPGSKVEVVDGSMKAELCFTDNYTSVLKFFISSGVKGSYGENVYGYLGYRLFSILTDSYYGVYGSASESASDISTNFGVYGSATSSNVNYGVYGSAYGGTENWAGFFSGAVHASGKVGIGTESPRKSLEISGTGLRMVDENPYSNNDYGDISFEDRGEGGLVLNSRTGGTWADMSFQTNGTTRMFLESRGNIGIGTTSPQERLDVAGNVRCQVLRITGGADLAEPFNVKDKKIIKPGMVLIIDPENPGQLKISEKAYDHCVAGIVSGAGKINPGMIMGQSASFGDEEYPVALTGRVYCMADASNGSIRPGDLLTTSMIPGHAMKASEYSRAQGAVLGKAMSSLESGQGLILVLVALQ